VLMAIDDGAHLLQRCGRDLLLGSAVVMLPMVVVGVVMANVAWRQFDRVDGVIADVGYVGAEQLVWLVAYVGELFTTALVGAYVATYSIDRQLGRTVGVASCLGRTVRRLPTLVRVFAVTHWWLAAMFLLATNMSPVELLGVSLLAAPFLAVVSALGLFAAPVAMAEPQEGVVRRTFALGRHSFGTAFTFVLANFLITTGVLGCIALLPQLAAATGLVSFGPWAWLVQGIATQLALLVALPLSAAGTTQLYLQVRMSREGADLWWEADRIFGVHR